MAGIFKNPLPELLEYEKFSDRLKNGKDPVGLTGCIDSEKVHLMSTFLEKGKTQLVVTYSEQRAREIEEDYKLFTGNVYVFPPKDLIFFYADLQGNAIATERIRALAAMYNKQADVIITTADALINALPDFEVFSSHVFKLKEGGVADPEELKKKLIVMGYERTGRVESPGQFAFHGGIADIFPMTSENPVRIEFFDDEIDSIRYFDQESQRSIEQISEAVIFPATEIIVEKQEREKAAAAISSEAQQQENVFKKNKQPDKAKQIKAEAERILENLSEDAVIEAPDGYINYFYNRTVHFSDYFPIKDTIVFLDEPVRLMERAETIAEEFEESVKNRLEQGYLLPGQTKVIITAREMLSSFEHRRVAAISSLDARFGYFTVGEDYSISVQNMSTYKEGMEYLIKDLTRWKKEKYRVVLLCPSHTKAHRLVSQLLEYDLNVYYSEQDDKEVMPGEIMVAYGNLHRGFMYPMLKFAVITESDIFGVKNKKKVRNHPEYKGEHISSFAQLKPGDYVVHETYGLGIYRGTQKQTANRVTKDYIKIEYGDGGNLYFPVTQLNMIQKFADAQAEKPKLNKLGTQEWSKTKSRVQKAVNNIAKELVELYALRQNTAGYAFGEDTVWQKEFEELVPFEETQDQLDAIDAAKADMESTKIMDRLVCGDVGYGKTEIAIRAAFKAVQDSKQVAFLVPTTILAQQHYNTFVQRMKDYPVKIELMSRFRSYAQIHKTLENIKSGAADIIIGTHRILSKDVVFKDLGLLIIDEEQRFGVTHKEKIKQMKKNVDVLTLTATPIPRTLHMSLIGVRDMSVLEQAPNERRPIQTYVMEHSWEMVREAVNRELARDGQVYYVYNRVKDIDQIAGKLAKLLPDARVAYAHGQMHEKVLEQIMMDFVNGDIDILVSTTIIETGLDIPNVNTIIIHDADRYGLSQLYQLRGRVGRSNRTSYAFIMYQHGKVLKEIAEKRLQAIKEYTQLGSGIKIAMRDLEIRGTGNILGSEQHGHMQEVGYDLYCKMLNLAVRKEKGELKAEESFDTVIDIPINAYIPDTYIRNDTEKMEMYKKIAVVETEEESMDMVDEMIDRFGEVPQPVLNLLTVAKLRAQAHRLYIKEIKSSGKQVRLFMYPQAKLNTMEIPGLIRSYNGALRLIDQGEPYFVLTASTGIVRSKVIDLETLKKLLNDIKTLIL